MLARITGVFVAMLCGYAGYWPARWALADYTVRSDVELALRLAPGNPDYYLRLAQARPALAIPALQRAASLNPMNSAVWIELADAAERDNDLPAAESSLLRAVQVDKTFAPRWLLAEYYSRRHDLDHFWPAVRAALAASYDDVTPLLELCWDLAPEPSTIVDRALPNRPDVWRQYFDFLLANNRMEAADAIASQVMQRASRDTVQSLLLYCDRLLQKDRVEQARQSWNLLAAKHLLDYPELAPARGVSLTNGAFAKEFLSLVFDWRVSAPAQVFYRHDITPSGVWFDFTGKQPEHCELLSQFVPLEPAKDYRLVTTYQTEGMAGDTGIAWRMVNVRTGADLLRGAGGLAASERREIAAPAKFHAPADAHLARLVLAYDRALGTVRIKGSLSLRSAALGFDR